MAENRLESQEVFRFLRSDELKAISDAAEVIELQSGQNVYQKGERADYFYVVLDGQVTLRLPGKAGVNLQIDELTSGDLFGSCVCFELDRYSLTAQCICDTRLLKIQSATLKELMDKDLPMGYAIQTQISRIYFSRYIDTMRKLQSIVMNLPIETA